MISTKFFNNFIRQFIRSLYEIAAVAQQILLIDLTHSLVAQPFCYPNDLMKILEWVGLDWP